MFPMCVLSSDVTAFSVRTCRWHYAFKCVLEVDVKRKRRMWSWMHMKRHRDLMTIYKQAYKKKLEQAKKSSEYMKVIEVSLQMQHHLPSFLICPLSSLHAVSPQHVMNMESI